MLSEIGIQRGPLKSADEYRAVPFDLNDGVRRAAENAPWLGKGRRSWAFRTHKATGSEDEVLASSVRCATISRRIGELLNSVIGDLTNRSLYRIRYKERMTTTINLQEGQSTDVPRRQSAGEERLVRMLKRWAIPCVFASCRHCRRQMCITQEIVETTPLAQSTVSQHLSAT